MDTRNVACGYDYCPGCPTLPERSEALMSAYQPALLAPQEWAAHVREALCIVRRSNARSESQLRTRLASLAGFLAWIQAPAGELTAHLTDARIRAYSATYGTAATQKRTSNRLQILRCAAHGLPLPEDLRSSTPSRQASVPRLATVLRVEHLTGGTPVRDALRALQLSPGQLEDLVTHLPAADLTAFQEVLRG